MLAQDPSDVRLDVILPVQLKQMTVENRPICIRPMETIVSLSINSQWEV